MPRLSNAEVTPLSTYTKAASLVRRAPTTANIANLVKAAHVYQSWYASTMFSTPTSAPVATVVPATPVAPATPAAVRKP